MNCNPPTFSPIGYFSVLLSRVMSLLERAAVQAALADRVTRDDVSGEYICIRVRISNCLGAKIVHNNKQNISGVQSSTGPFYRQFPAQILQPAFIYSIYIYLNTYITLKHQSNHIYAIKSTTTVKPNPPSLFLPSPPSPPTSRALLPVLQDWNHHGIRSNAGNSG